MAALTEIILSCPICYELYESENPARVPMMNTFCGHTICYECKNKIQNGTCSLCNQKTPERYMKNFALLDQIRLILLIEKTNVSAVSATTVVDQTTEQNETMCTFDVFIYNPMTETELECGQFHFCKPAKVLAWNSLVGAAKNALYSVNQKKVDNLRIYFQTVQNTYGELNLLDSDYAKRIGVPFPNHSTIILEDASYRSYHHARSFAEHVFQKKYLV